MQLKISLKGVSFVASIVGIISGAIALFFVLINPSDARSIPSIDRSSSPQDIRYEPMGLAKGSISSRGIPTRLMIPKIRVNISIEHVGLTPEGAMGVPKNFINTAWFELGPRPGDRGSAVIDGHFGFIKKKPGAFNNLHRLRKGDKISVQDEKGVVVSFVVRESRIYRQDEDVPEVFASSDGKAHLNLITCQGIWNKSKKSYSERLVVFTDLVP